MESLFLGSPLEFEKQAAIAKLSDNPDNWTAEIGAELYRALPFLNKFTIEVRTDRVDPERGAGVGVAVVKNRTFRNPVEALQGGQINYARIPIIVQNHFLQPVDIFIHKNDIMPLTEEDNLVYSAVSGDGQGQFEYR